MNEGNIMIINGYVYETYSGYCPSCDLKKECWNATRDLCYILGVPNKRFKKSDKSLKDDLPKKTLQFNIDGYLSSYCNYPIANNNI